MSSHLGQRKDVGNAVRVEPHRSVPGKFAHEVCLDTAGVAMNSKGLLAATNILEEAAVGKDVHRRLVVQQNPALGKFPCLPDLTTHIGF
jgi:hypothetical protein